MSPGDPTTMQVPAAVGLRTHYCGTLCEKELGKTVSVCGWVAHRREHGEHLSFVDVRDHTGLIQCVIDAKTGLRAEYVVRVTGTVSSRPEGTENDQLSTGKVELTSCEVEVLSTSEPPPIPLDARAEADEAQRLRARYIDLRSARMQKNLRLRARVNSAIRDAMEEQGFTEIETPLLWTPTPEGAREFAIPSRLQHGHFYVLPQSPQIAKQLTMVGGFDRYYQIARCMRDEDQRADRQFEFTQLDMEASFVEEGDVRAFVEVAVSAATKAAVGVEPEPFVTMTWQQAMDDYGTEKPDLRFGSTLVELTDVFSATAFNAFKAPCVKAIAVPDAALLGRARLDALVERARELGAKGLVWMRANKIEEGIELDSPVTRHLSEDELRGICSRLEVKEADLVLVVADERRVVNAVLGQLRLDLCRPPVAQGPYRFCWVVDFPLFEGRDQAGHLLAAHHPFTMPKSEDLELFETNPEAIRAQSYDLVLNGWELGSGSIRIHRADIQEQVFSALGISKEDADLRFGFLLGALRFGAPPHGGFAFGIDRLVAILAGEENIREVIAFPKTQSGSDLMTGAPLPLAPAQLAELGISIRPTPQAGTG